MAKKLTAKHKKITQRNTKKRKETQRKIFLICESVAKKARIVPHNDKFTENNKFHKEFRKNNRINAALFYIFARLKKQMQ